MKTRHEFILAMVATSMLVFAMQDNVVSAAEPPTQSKVSSATGTQQAVHLTISGTITNFDGFAACVEPKTSYIQLVPWDGRSYDTLYTRDGRIVVVSKLDKWKVPTKATFSFDAPNISPGKYLLAAQELKCNPPRPFFLNGNKFLVIDVPADAKSPFIIKVGDLPVNIN